MSLMIRGIGDPLIASYARAYLVHVGFMVFKERMRPITLSIFDDFLFTFNELERSQFEAVDCIKKDKINKEDYIDLYTPCLDWILQSVRSQSDDQEFVALIQRYKERWTDCSILNSQIVFSYTK